jgi:hypothetical protein
MSLALKKNNEINLFCSVVYHVSFCIFLSLLVLHNAIIAIKITLYVTSDFISTFTKQFIMIAAERSTSIAKSCLVLVEFLAMNYIKYIDFALDEEQKEKIISEKSPIKTILTNASKKVQAVQAPVKKAQNTPIVSPEILKKSEAVRKNATTHTNTANKETEASSTALSIFAELSLRKAGKYSIN